MGTDAEARGNAYRNLFDVPGACVDRAMLPVEPRQADCDAPRWTLGESGQVVASARLSVASYNVLADANSIKLLDCPEPLTSWTRRRELLLQEIVMAR